MSDLFNQNNDSHENNGQQTNGPVNGEYRYRTYDLENRQKPLQEQATFGSGSWQEEAPAGQDEPQAKKQGIRWGRVLLSATAALLAAAMCFGAGYAGVLVANRKNTVVLQQITGDPSDQAAPALPQNPEGTLTSVQVAAKVEQSVVAITTEHMTTSNFWFGNYVTSGAGSGVIISEDGYILTCAHVIDGASRITVELMGGEQIDAQLVGSYTNGDIAVIKIEKTGLTPAQLADSDALRQGETCYAVGNPEGRFSGSISDGIISALDRTITVQVEDSSANNNRGNSLYDMFYGGGTYMRNIQLNVLQMTAAVSPGNSGGALFNDRGQLIGIVSAKSAASSSEGLGFAIPVNTAMDIASQLIASGSYVPEGVQQNPDGTTVAATSNKAILGITVTAIDQQQAYQYNMKPGIYVSTITEKTTEQAGLQVGDRIISVDDVMVSATTDVTGYLADKQVGDQVQLNVEREGRMVTVRVTLVENPEAN